MIRKTLTLAVALAGLVIPAVAQAAPVCGQGDPPIRTCSPRELLSAALAAALPVIG
jgi:hypothetical protein